MVRTRDREPVTQAESEIASLQRYWAQTLLVFIDCQQAVNRARRILFQLRRRFAVPKPEIIRPLYLVLVRPILEYGQ